MKHFDTIVIGAGISGLTTAQFLTRAGQNVVVLEARDRTGGRVHSRTDERGVTTDLGASWVHGIEDEPVADLVKKLGIKTVEFTVGGHQAASRPMLNVHSTGTPFSREDNMQWAADADLINELLDQELARTGRGVSFQQVVEEVLAALNWDHDRIDRAHEYFRRHTEEQYGVTWESMDAHGLDSDEVFGDEWIFPDGYSQLTRVLENGLDIRLDHVVTKIVWDVHTVVVHTTLGTFTADRAVVTLPVGVLHGGDVTFEPQLPEAVANPLARLRMNAFEKVFVEFSEKFWPDDIYVLRQHGVSNSPWHSWYDMSRATGRPTLLAFPGADHARRVVQQSQADIQSEVVDSLAQITGTKAPEPVHITVTDWQADPFSYGSYAYMTVGSAISDHDDLAAPLAQGALHLSGEATWGEDPATVPAALRSGHRAAERILDTTLDILDLAELP